MNYTWQHYYILLGGMLLDRDLSEQAFGVLEGRHFTSPELQGRPIQGLIFEAIRQHLADHGVLPDHAWLRFHLSSMLEQMVPDEAIRSAMETELEGFLIRAGAVTKASKDFSLKMVADIANEVVHKPAVSQILQDAAFRGEAVDPQELISQLQEIQDRRTSGQTNDLLVGDVFSEPVSNDGKRRRTGVPWYDQLFGEGKGPVTGAVTGILAPQGGGKSTLGNELAIAGALLGEHTLLAMAEEGMTRSMKLRVLARTTGLATTVLEKVNFWDVKEVCNLAVQYGLDGDQVGHRIELVRKHLHVVDLIHLDGGMEEVERVVRKLADEGTMPQLIYLDWAGIMADRVMQMGLKGRKFDDKRFALDALATAAAALATETNQQLFYSHQMCAAAVEKGPCYRARNTDALDNKMWTANFKYCVTIGPRCTKTGVQLLHIPKARDDKPDQVLNLKLNGPLQTFEDVTSFFTPGGKNFRTLRERPTNNIPSDKPKGNHEIE